MRSRLVALVPLIALLLVPAAKPLVAQQPAYKPSPFYVKYGKWLLLAATAGMSYKAAQSHDKADDAFNNLEDYCFDDIARCNQLPNGKYADPISEQYYQTSVHYDKQARNWLIGGEAALLGSAALFVWELTRPKRPTENIPFEPQVTVVGSQTRLGFRIGF